MSAGPPYDNTNENFRNTFLLILVIMYASQVSNICFHWLIIYGDFLNFKFVHIYSKFQILISLESKYMCVTNFDGHIQTYKLNYLKKVKKNKCHIQTY